MIYNRHYIYIYIYIIKNKFLLIFNLKKYNIFIYKKEFAK